MLLSTISLLVLPGLPRVHALPTIDLVRVPRALGTGENTDGNKPSPKIIIPVVLAVVLFLMLLVAGWWRRRRRMRQVVSDIRNASTTNTTTTTANRTDTSTRTPITAPGTGPDAPPRPPRRRRRRRQSQISTKSLPAYNEQAGDEEIVLVRRAERGSMSDDDDDYDDNPSDARHSTHENSRPFDSTPLLDDTSPEMGRISLASSGRGRSIGNHDEPDSPQHPTRPNPSNDTSISLPMTEDVPDDSAVPVSNEEGASTADIPLDDAPSYTEAVDASRELDSSTHQTARGEQPSETGENAAGPSTSGPGDMAETDALGTLRPKRKSVFRQFFALNKPGTSSTAPSDSVEMSSAPARQSLSAASAIQSTSNHRPSNSISTLASTAASGRGHALSPSLSSLLLTRSRSPTRSSDSLAQRLNISAPIPATLVRTELSYPRSGPTPEQIRFLSSRDSLGRFGMPYGEEALAAAARSRENISSMASPPQYQGLSTENATSEAQTATTASNSPTAITTLAHAGNSTSESAAEPPSTEALSLPASTPLDVGTVNNDAGSTSLYTDQSDALPVSASDSAMPNIDRRDSMISTNSFVTADEGDRETVAEGDDEDTSDSSPPTPTAETYRQAESQGDTVSQARPRGQTILVPSSETDAAHPQLAFIPATPTVDVPVRVDHAA